MKRLTNQLSEDGQTLKAANGWEILCDVQCSVCIVIGSFRRLAVGTYCRVCCYIFLHTFLHFLTHRPERVW